MIIESMLIDVDQVTFAYFGGSIFFGYRREPRLVMPVLRQIWRGNLDISMGVLTGIVGR